MTTLYYFICITALLLLSDHGSQVLAGLDCDPETCVVKFPKEFGAMVLKFYRAAATDRGEIIKELGNPKTDLKIKRIDVIPGELLQDATSRNYIASLSMNNRKNVGSNEWQENYDTNAGGCSFYGRYRQGRCSQYLINFNLFRDNSENTGFRYAYSCETKLEISCKLSGCIYDPATPFHLPTGEPIYVKKLNIMKPDGRGVDEDPQFTDSSDEVMRFNGTQSMIFRLCKSRSIYYATQVTLKGGSEEKRNGYFVQNENAESQSGIPSDPDFNTRKTWFLYLS